MLMIILFFIIPLIKSFVLAQTIIANIFANLIELKIMALRYARKHLIELAEKLKNDGLM